ncbi:hypothetical protein GDO86_019748 [Hymenochirus boettgeri]|uniref:Uncharacterized protein n=1 Tax=Hymenochirus boettgeri TaxID=247094 RepID=A0A8T2IIM7_9PIPI|nr:hypothetical protein GDO86_019748 [Hymenochirus boettgeri]
MLVGLSSWHLHPRQLICHPSFPRFIKWAIDFQSQRDFFFHVQVNDENKTFIVILQNNIQHCQNGPQLFPSTGFLTSFYL